VWTVGRRGLVLTLLGLVVGAGVSALAAPWIEHAIWGVTPWDPTTVVLVVACLLAATATASFLPAVRVARLEPARILRE
jgi:ABC-type antimicrobial peptide transport system permease subunit